MAKPNPSLAAMEQQLSGKMKPPSVGKKKPSIKKMAPQAGGQY